MVADEVADMVVDEVADMVVGGPGSGVGGPGSGVGGPGSGGPGGRPRSRGQTGPKTSSIYIWLSLFTLIQSSKYSYM